MTATHKTVTAAAVYARISDDRGGEALGVTRQQELCRTLAGDKGWPVGECYVDNDLSAYSGAPRPAYRRMLDDIAAGVVDAVVCVDLDRLTRRPAELEEFVELADAHGVALANVSGDTDLSTSDGRFKARILGAVARQESEKKSERIRRQKEQSARLGQPHGGPRAYGYADGAVVPAEAEVVREAARRVLAGESMHAICVDWNSRGLRTLNGREWQVTPLTRILKAPRIAGLRVHHGEVVGDAEWDGILPRDEWEKVKSKLATSGRPRRGRPATRLLAGIAVCGRCGGPLWSSWSTYPDGTKKDRYRCMTGPARVGCGRLTVTATPLDAEVRDQALAALSGPALAEARRQAAGDDPAQKRAAVELADAEARLEEIGVMMGAGEMDRRGYLAAKETVHRRIRDARRVLDRNGRGRTLADLPADPDALRAAWDSWDVHKRRALLRAVVDRVVVAPPARPTNRFDPGRVTVVWRA